MLAVRYHSHMIQLSLYDTSFIEVDLNGTQYLTRTSSHKNDSNFNLIVCDYAVSDGQFNQSFRAWAFDASPSICIDFVFSNKRAWYALNNNK